MLCEMSATSNCNTLKIMNANINENSANKKSDFSVSKKDEEFAQHEDTSASSNCDITNILNINLNEAERKEDIRINRKSELFVSHNESVTMSSSNDILNTAFIDVDEIMINVNSEFIFEDKELAQYENMKISKQSVIFNDMDINVYVENARINMPNFVTVSDFEEENIAKIEFSSDFACNVPRYSSTPISSQSNSPYQQSQAFPSRIIPIDNIKFEDLPLDDNLINQFNKFVISPR